MLSGGMIMLVKFVWWFVILGLSLVVERIGIAEQGIAFVCIEIAVLVCVIAAIAVYMQMKMQIKDPSWIFYYFVLPCICLYGVRIIAVLTVTRIFEIEFLIAYQIISFGYGLGIPTKVKQQSVIFDLKKEC